MTQSTQERLDALDRDMNAVFETMTMLKGTLAAVVQSLPAPQSAQVLPKLDQTLDELLKDKPGTAMVVLTLNTWRNQVAQNAGLPARQL
ncbi:hypothetical protein [uncultured Deefgea sp.]|uniref:hypothetical protein n=1 Tax=uncultured Deefgea sp. TaxID=1304914 RepID=UPI0026224972|nr:hypothetical protein [uncultured Deefgea sp.]